MLLVLACSAPPAPPHAAKRWRNFRPAHGAAASPGGPRVPVRIQRLKACVTHDQLCFGGCQAVPASWTCSGCGVGDGGCFTVQVHGFLSARRASMRSLICCWVGCSHWCQPTGGFHCWKWGRRSMPHHRQPFGLINGLPPGLRARTSPCGPGASRRGRAPGCRGAAHTREDVSGRQSTHTPVRHTPGMP